jgi:hypothetical protein
MTLEIKEQVHEPFAMNVTLSERLSSVRYLIASNSDFSTIDARRHHMQFSQELLIVSRNQPDDIETISDVLEVIELLETILPPQ